MKFSIIKYFGIIILCLLSLLACKHESKAVSTKMPSISVRSSVNNPSIHVGDLLEYSIKVNASSNIIFRIPEVTEDLGGFAVRNIKLSPLATMLNGRVEQSCTYFLETYLLGEYELPALTVDYEDLNGTNIIKSTPIFVEVVSVAAAGDLFEGIRDIKEPLDYIELQSTRANYWYYIIIAGLLVVILILILRRRKVKEKVAPAPTPAHIIALSELSELAGLHLLEQALFKEYYFKLSNILRHYIENRFSIRAPEQTTEEFLMTLKENPAFKSEQRQILKQFLLECDLIKFANYDTSNQDAEKANSTVVSFIDQTYKANSREEV